jgi:peptidoglycan hydrolase-like protein with peptidoglycan-binding domain
MSIKFTKSEIQEIILQETAELLYEVNLTNARKLAKYLKNFKNKVPTGADLSKFMDDFKRLGLEADSDIAINSLKTYGPKQLDDVAAEMQKIEVGIADMLKNGEKTLGKSAYDRLIKMQEKVQDRRFQINRLIKNSKKAAARGGDAAADATKAGKKLPEPAKVTAKVAKTSDGVFRKLVAGTGLAALGLLIPGLSNMFKDADAKDPDEEEVKKEIEKKDPRKVKKALETAKQRRTRIAHATIKAKSPKDSVIRFQARLGALGYDLGSFGIDGDYGGATLDAVRAFQKNNGLDTDGIVGPNTWSKMTADDAKGASDASTGLPKSPDGSAAVTKMGSNVISKIEALDANDEKLRRVYEKVSRGLERALRNNDVPGKAANTTVRKFLPVIKPDAYGNDMESVKKQKIMRLQRVLDKGLPLAMGDRSVTIGQEVVIDIIEDVLRQEQIMQESKSYDMRFDKWSRLWD